jgi:hypothetical protein
MPEMSAGNSYGLAILFPVSHLFEYRQRFIADVMLHAFGIGICRYGIDTDR